MQATTINFPDNELAEIDRLWRKHGFSSRSVFLRYAGLHFEESQHDEAMFRLLADAVFTLHQIRRAQTGRLHLLKNKDLKVIGMLLSRIADTMASLAGHP
ncbi:MAG: ribbon-helix-helix domain-containing protein [Alphaproteobacteria bacterium]|nr:ribbon-helix-helix domain-containing protein [Alphaproteobacteria bacterium]